MNLNVRYGRMTTALSTRPAIQRVGQKRRRTTRRALLRPVGQASSLSLEEIIEYQIDNSRLTTGAAFSNRADYDVIRCKAAPLEMVLHGLLFRDTLWMATER